MNISFENNKQAEKKYGFLGIPWDQGDVNGVPGSRGGADLIRGFLAKVINNIDENNLLDCERWEMINTDNMLVKDFGNADDFKCFDWDYSIHLFSEKVRKIAADGYKPLVAGGDCCINYPSVKGLHDNAEGNIGVIYMDAHLDVWNDFSKFGRYSHASPLLNIANLERVDGNNIVHFGTRGYRSTQAKENYQFMTENKMKIITYPAFKKEGIEATAERILTQVTKNTDKVALAIDIDVIEQSYAPGSSANEPSGPNSYEMHELIKALAPRVDCMSISEVNPLIDVNNHTSRRAARLFLDYLVNNYAPQK